MSEEKEIEGKTTTTGKQSSAGIVGRFLSVFDVMGEHSMKQIVLSLPFILFLLLLAFLHIANNNLADQYVRKITREEKELKMYRWQYMTVSSKLMKVTKQSEIAKRVEDKGLKELRQAPMIIEVQNNKRVSNKMAAKTNIKKEMMVRIYIGFLFICLLGCGIIGQTVYIQNVKGNYYRKLSDTLTIFPMTIRADRGNIYAKEGSLLATSLPIFDLYIDFAADGLKKETLRKNIDSVALLMENMFHDKSAAQYKNEFQYNREKRSRYYSVLKSVTFDQMSEIRKWPLFRLGRNKSGLIEETKEMRDHAFGLLALRTLGVDENLDGVYSSGIELKYNEQLQGVCGKKLVQKLGAGVVRPLDSKDEIAPQPGLRPVPDGPAKP